MLANWVTSLTNAREGTLISSYSYTYYASGNRRSESDSTGKVTSYTYDGAGRLVCESKADESISYAYDRFGNRASMTVSGSEGYTTTYAYDANNRLVSEVKDDVTTTYTYDNNGNTIGKAAGTRLDVYSYNLYNQIATIK